MYRPATFYRISLSIACLLQLTACNVFRVKEDPTPVSKTANETTVVRSTPAPAPTIIQTPIATPTQTLVPTWTKIPTITNTPLPTNTPTITPTPTITDTPTPVVLLSRVNTLAQCRYGPGRAYLYKLGLEVGDELAVIGRNEKGTWAQVTPLDRKFPCWVSAGLIDVQGDLMSVPLAYVWLPQSPYYGPLRDVRAVRRGGSVLITWRAMKLRKGDDSGQNRYLVEAWVCDGREVTLVAVGTNEPFVEIDDSSGCSGGSHARVYGVEKHGYTPPVNVSW